MTSNLSSITLPFDSINMQDIPRIARQAPQHTQFLLGLFEIDARIKAMAKEVTKVKSDVDRYAIKTELGNNLYTLSLYNMETKNVTSYSWTLDDLLIKCDNEIIGDEIEAIVSKLL